MRRPRRAAPGRAATTVTSIVAPIVAPIVALAAAAACTPGGTDPVPPVAGAPAPNAVVTHIDDGDTIDVRVGGTVERVRFIGVDTPETKKPNTPVQCYGPQASAFTAAFLPLGAGVRLERDAEPRDPYGRLLAYVYRASDGAFVNLELARRGYARQLSIAPNTADADELGAAVGEAQRAGRGLWAACSAFGVPASPAGVAAPGGG